MTKDSNVFFFVAVDLPIDYWIFIYLKKNKFQHPVSFENLKKCSKIK